MAECLQVGTYSILVKRHPRRKRLALRVNQGVVEVLSPPHLSSQTLWQFANQHQAWWLKALSKTQQGADIVPFEVAQDAVWPWLDGALRLQFSFGEPHSFVQHGQWHCRLSNPDCEQQRRAAWQAWCSQQALAYLSERTALFSGVTELVPSAIQIKSYRARWGSCDPKRRIQFNYKLMLLPGWVVDYVVVHELCHLRHMNHSSAFWQSVNRYYPRTPEAKAWLKQHGYQRIQQASKL